jgi:hypothetical protein
MGNRSFGALTSSTIMTVRQFLSILVNAQIYSSAISFQGWLGITTVGMGIWLKMYRGFDETSSTSKPIGGKHGGEVGRNGNGHGNGMTNSLSTGEEQELNELLKDDDLTRNGHDHDNEDVELEKIIIKS